jgi:hypothetical protein
MIRSSIMYFLLLMSFSCVAQQVKISGTLRASDGRAFYPRAILNDTLQRFFMKNVSIDEPGEEENNLRLYRRFEALSNDSSVIVRPDSLGKFSMTASIRDSIIFGAYNFHTQRYAVKDLLKGRVVNIVLEEIPCVPYEECTSPSGKMYVFVGEKISVDLVERKNYCNRFILDSEYGAKYKIVKNLYGDYRGDTIQFTAYDHYGKPPFSKHKHVLLFVTEYCGKLIHEKYQYFDVYPTENGRWASPGNPWRFDRPDTTVVQGEVIPFGNLTFDKYLDKRYRNMKFNAPYFKIDGNCVVPIMGSYVEDLFEIKKKTTLKAGGFTFEKSK